jgi:hypothetical protein
MRRIIIYYKNRYSHLSVGNNEENFYLIGQPFLRDYYTVFDMDKSIIIASSAAKKWRLIIYFLTKTND